MSPFDINTDWGHKLAQHIPALGAVVASARVSGEQTVQLWQLVVAIVSLTVALCTSVYWLARDQEQLRGLLSVINAQQAAQDAIIARVVNRQDVNTDEINKLKAQTAVMANIEDRMTREHADIYQAIRNKRPQ